MIQEQFIEGNRLIDEFMEVEPVIEYCVGKDDSICYSPSNLKEYFPNSYSQKIESERWLKEQHEKYPNGWVTKEGYGVKGIVHYTSYHSDWNHLIPVCKKASDIALNQPNRPSINHCSHLDWLESEIAIAMRDYEIEKVWQAVVEFIKYYNQNKHS